MSPKKFLTKCKYYVLFPDIFAYGNEILGLRQISFYFVLKIVLLDILILPFPTTEHRALHLMRGISY